MFSSFFFFFFQKNEKKMLVFPLREMYSPSPTSSSSFLHNLQHHFTITLRSIDSPPLFAYTFFFSRMHLPFACSFLFLFFLFFLSFIINPPRRYPPPPPPPPHHHPPHHHTQHTEVPTLVSMHLVSKIFFSSQN